MMQLLPRLILLRALVVVTLQVAASACGSSATTSTAPSPITRCAITLNTSDTTLPADGGSGAIAVNATRECTWSSSVEGSWLTVKSGANGQGDGTVEFTAAPNPDPQTRSGAVLVNGSRAQITQAAGECVVTLGTSSAELPPAGGTARIDVRASSQLCAWTVTSDAPWIEITSGATGRGSGAVTVSVAPTGGPPRTGIVTIAGQRFSVTQSEGCTYSIDRSGHPAPANGGSAIVTVTTAPACPWRAASNAEWITVNPATGSGPGAVTFSVAPTQGPQRTGTAVIAGQLFTVTQSPGCTYEVQPTTHSVGASGGTAAVSVSTATGCSWTAASNAAWIVMQGSMSGSGPGNVTFSVAATSGPARSGTLTVAGHQVSVSQTQGCSYSISPQSQSVASSGGTGKVTVTAGEGCTWSAASSASWVTITSGTNGSGNGEVQFSVAATTGPARSATLTIAGQTFTVSQGEGCSVQLSPSTVTIGDEGGQRSFEVQTAAGCGWTANTATSWITINSGASGSGNGTVRFTVTPNSGPGRTGSITAGGQTFTVNQGQGCTFTLSPSNVTIEDEGGPRSFDVQTAAGCGWTAATSTPWITINSGASGSGTGTVRFTVASNSGPTRTGTITAAGQTFTVNQGQGCTFRLSASSVDINEAGGQRTFDVQTAAGCGWAAATSTSWITINSGASGSGNGTVRFTAATNSGPSRTGTITAAGQTFTVNQGGGCTFALSANSQSVPAGGGTGTVNVTAGGGCSWTAASNASWLTITSGASGTGNGSVGFTAAANTGPSRSGTLTIAGRTFTVSQAEACTYSINPPQQGVPGAGGTIDVSVSAPGGCTWSAVSNVPWMTVASGASGAGDGPVRLNVEPNGGGARTGTATIAGRTFTVEQGSGCTYAIAPASQSLSAAGGTATVNVTAQGSCGWTATSNAPWIVVTSGATGSGNGAVQMNVEANTGSVRTGTATVAGQTFTITQEAGCSFAVAPTTVASPAAGVSARIEVTTSAGCAWTATSDASWITIAAGESGSGPGNVDLSVTANTGPARSSAVTVAGRTVTVSQESGCTVTLTPAAQTIPPAGGTGAVNVTAGAGCTWTAVSAVPWIVVTSGASGSGDGVVQFTVDANGTGEPRSGAIAIGGQTFTVNQQ